MSLTQSHWPPSPQRDAEATTIGGALVDAARRWPDKLALVEGVPSPAARQWTFNELLGDATTVAGTLLAHFQPGDRVAIFSGNRPEWVLVQFGAALAGVTVVTVNPAYGRSELLYVLKQSRAHGVIVEHDDGRDLPGLVQVVASQLPELHTVLPADPAVLLDPSERDVSLPVVRHTDPAQIQYTSGTTGFPKGAVLAHHSLALNGRLYAEAIGASAEDVWINPMPLFHTAGCGLVTLGALQSGGTHVLPPRFDAAMMLDLFAEHRGTILLSVPTMLIRMLEAQSQAPRDVSSWRLATLGGAPVPTELVRRAETVFGVSVGIGFGQTEASPYITHTQPDDPHPEWFTTIGRALPGVEVRVVDPETGVVAPLNTVGEIHTRSDCVMLGYFDDQAATQKAITPDGWLRTGDLGAMDEHGYLRIEGRLRDMIIRGGENIYPREVEEVLHTHPAVSNVAVVGVPDPEYGEIVAAFVQPRPGEHPTPSDLADHCRQHLARFKVPAVWRLVNDFPQTGSGKIQKFALRESYAAGAEHAVVKDGVST